MFLVEGGFCYNLGQTIVIHEVDEPPGEFWLATSTLHAVPFPVVTWDVEFPIYPDVTVGFVQINDKDFSNASTLTVSFSFGW